MTNTFHCASTFSLRQNWKCNFSTVPLYIYFPPRILYDDTHFSVNTISLFKNIRKRFVSLNKSSRFRKFYPIYAKKKYTFSLLGFLRKLRFHCNGSTDIASLKTTDLNTQIKYRLYIQTTLKRLRNYLFTPNTRATESPANGLPTTENTWRAMRAFTGSTTRVKSPVDRITVAFPLLSLTDRKTDGRHQAHAEVRELSEG